MQVTLDEAPGETGVELTTDPFSPLTTNSAPPVVPTKIWFVDDEYDRAVPTSGRVCSFAGPSAVTTDSSLLLVITNALPPAPNFTSWMFPFTVDFAVTLCCWRSTKYTVFPEPHTNSLASAQTSPCAMSSPTWMVVGYESSLSNTSTRPDLSTLTIFSPTLLKILMGSLCAKIRCVGRL